MSSEQPLLQHDHLLKTPIITDNKSANIPRHSESLETSQPLINTENQENKNCCLFWLKKMIDKICSFFKALFSYLSLPVAALFESLDSTLGMFMAGIVFSEAVNVHSFYWSLGIAGFFGVLIWYYTYKLLAIKEQEENKKNVDKLKITCMANFFFALTAIAAGLDACAAFSQQTVQRWNSSKFIASAFLMLGVLSLICRAAKYYISDLGTQISDPKKLTFIHWFTEKSKCIRKPLQGAVFQLFPFGEAVAHLLAAYIIYSDLIQPYFSGNPGLAWTLGVMGVLIGCLAFFAQYVIICAADLDWAAQTLEKKKGGVSNQIDNRFGMIGQILLGCAAYTTLLFCNSSKIAFKRLRRQIKYSKILGQGVFVGAGCLLLVSIICTGLSTSDVAGSIPGITIHHTPIAAWGVALGVFMLGYIPGVFLGFRQWKAKNDAGDEVDCFIERFVRNYHWEIDDLGREYTQKRDALPRLWIAVDQNRQSERLCKRLCNKKNQKVFVFSFLLGAALGVGYSIETLDPHFNKLIVNAKLYGFAAIGGSSFMLVAAIIIAFGRKELLYKGELPANDALDINSDHEQEQEEKDKNDAILSDDDTLNAEQIIEPTKLMQNQQ
jgi:hypothetical protein